MIAGKTKRLGPRQIIGPSFFTKGAFDDAKNTEFLRCA